MANSLSAIVLAGGQSSRMGRDKALIEIEGVPLLKRVCDAALECTEFVYVSTSWRDRYSFLPPSVQFITEEKPRSPLVAFSEALTQISTEWVLLLACDLPRIEGAILQEWMSQLAGVSETAILRSVAEPIAVLPKHPKGWEPLCGFYRKAGLEGLQEYLKQGKRSFQGWLELEQVEELKVSDRQVLENCNTPEDLSRILN